MYSMHKTECTGPQTCFVFCYNHAPERCVLQNCLQATCPESPEPSEDNVADRAKPETTKPEFPLAQSGVTDSPEPEGEIEVELPQCEESVFETPAAEAVAGVACESCDDKADSADELHKATPAAPDQAAISHTQTAPEVCFRFAALVS